MKIVRIEKRGQPAEVLLIAETDEEEAAFTVLGFKRDGTALTFPDRPLRVSPVAMMPWIEGEKAAAVLVIRQAEIDGISCVIGRAPDSGVLRQLPDGSEDYLPGSPPLEEIARVPEPMSCYTACGNSVPSRSLRDGSHDCPAACRAQQPGYTG